MKNILLKLDAIEGKKNPVSFSDDRKQLNKGQKYGDDTTVMEENKMSIKQLAFNNLPEDEGIVILGAGGNLQDWIDGVFKIWQEEGYTKATSPNQIFSNAYKLTTTGGRTDLALTFAPNAQIDTGRIAMWRIGFGDCSWISDYKHNYANQHGFTHHDDSENELDEDQYGQVKYKTLNAWAFDAGELGAKVIDAGEGEYTATNNDTVIGAYSKEQHAGWLYNPQGKTKGIDRTEINYAHKTDPKGARFTQYKKDKLPPWAVDVKDIDEEACMYEGATYTTATPYGVQYRIFAGKEQRLTNKEAWFKSSEAMERGIKKIEELGNFYEIVGHHYPEEKEDVEVEESAGNKTFKILIQYTDPSGKGTASATYNISSVTDSKHATHVAKIRANEEGLKNVSITRATEVKSKVKDESTYDSGGADQFSGSGSAQVNETPAKVDAVTEKARMIREKLRDAGFTVQYTDRLKSGGWSLKLGFHDLYRLEKVESQIRKLLKDDNVVIKKVDQNLDYSYRQFDGVLRVLVRPEVVESTLTELKKSTLGSYIKRASKDMSGHRSAAGFLSTHNYGPQEDNDMKWHSKKVDQRKKGIDTAVDKLTRESKLTEKSKTKKQAKFMAACAHGAGYKSCPPMSVSKEFNKADTGTKQLSQAMKHKKTYETENNMKKHTIKESILVEDPSLEKVLRHFGKEVRDFQENGDLDDHLFNALYDFYFDEMPYGTKKARDGDPYEWISERLYKELGGPVDISKVGEAAAGDAPVYEESLENIDDDFIEGERVHWQESDGPVHEGTVAEIDGNLVLVDLDEGGQKWVSCYVLEKTELDLDEGIDGEMYFIIDPETLDVLEGPFKNSNDANTVFLSNYRKLESQGLAELCSSEELQAKVSELDEGEGSAGYDWHQQMAAQASPAKVSPTITTQAKAKLDAARAAAISANASAPAGGKMAPPQLKRPGQISSVQEEWDNEEEQTMFNTDISTNPRGEYDISEPTDNLDNLDETFLIENNEELITQILEELGLDHGLDFFFDNGLVAIGKSTARVIINALKSDSRIKATPSFGRIDGEEVQIKFGKEETTSLSSSEERELAHSPEHDAEFFESDENQDDQVKYKTLTQLDKKSMLADRKQEKLNALEDKLAANGYTRSKDDAGGEYQFNWTKEGAPTYVVNYRFGNNGYAEFWKKIDENQDDSENESIVKEEVSMSINANGEEDVLNVIRKLSGLATVQAGPEVNAIAEPETEIAVIGPEEEMEEAEGEYVNAPDDPNNKYMDTDSMMNQGDKNQRSVTSMAPKAYGGDNPATAMINNHQMKESLRLLKQYEFMKSEIKSK